MPLANTNTALDGYNAAVRNKWLSSNFGYLGTQNSPVLKHFKMKGRIQPHGYGVVMEEPLEVPVTTGPQLQGISNDYAPIQPQPMTGFIAATYNLALMGMNISWTVRQMMKARGPEEMVKWQQAILKNATNRFWNSLMDMFWAAPELPTSWGTEQNIGSIRWMLNGGGTVATGGGASPAPRASQSQVPIVSATGAGVTGMLAPGNLPRNSVGGAYWCTPIIYGSVVSPGSTPLTLLNLNDAYEQGYCDGKCVDYIATPSMLFSKLANILTVGGTNGGMVLAQGDTATFGFSHLIFRGARIVSDDRCPTTGYQYGTSTSIGNQMFGINSEMFTLYLTGSKPDFHDVPSNAPIHEEFGTIGGSLTSKHLGNVGFVLAQCTQ